jgi:hypothetical protein
LNRWAFSASAALAAPCNSRAAAVLEHVKGIGVEHKLHMLPVLKKPYETEAVVKIIQDLKLGLAAATAKIDIEQALADNWIEFWYQPKIALRKKQLAGAEAYARAIRNTASCCRVRSWPTPRNRASPNCPSWP